MVPSPQGPLGRLSPFGPRVRAQDDAGAPTRIGFRAFAPWKLSHAWGLPEPLLPLLIAILIIAGVATFARYAGPAVIAVLLFSPMATTWLGLGIALTIWGMHAWPRHLARARAASLFRDKQCPACRYALAPTETPPPSNSPPPLTRCPECGSSWNLTPPGPPKRFRVTVTKR